MLQVTYDLLQGHVDSFAALFRDLADYTDALLRRLPPAELPAYIHSYVSAYCCWHEQGCSARRVDLWFPIRENLVFCTIFRALCLGFLLSNQRIYLCLFVILKKKGKKINNAKLWVQIGLIKNSFF